MGLVFTRDLGVTEVPAGIASGSTHPHEGWLLPVLSRDPIGFTSRMRERRGGLRHAMRCVSDEDPQWIEGRIPVASVALSDRPFA